MIKTRFAPSPTGFLHIGSLRTALFAYLFAKKNNGRLVLRIEDTDRERFVEGGVENILNSLYWTGIIPDEGVKFDEEKNIIQIGKNGPYIQSERLGIYNKYIDELIKKNQAYYCFCSKERLQELREIQQKNNKPTGYDGSCRDCSPDEVEKRLKAGENYVIRLKMPNNGVTKFSDLVRGEVKFENKLIDDQVLIKADGFPTYHFAVVIDDHLMGISHVIRGEEWISSTPKHIAIYKAFGWQIPEFAHISLLVNEKKQKLSKRHGDVSVEDFREKGYLPQALINFAAFLGWNPGDEREIFSLEELEKEFDIDKLTKAAAVFNRDKLNWYNKKYMMELPINKLTSFSIPFFKNSGVLKKIDIDEPHEFEKLSNAINLEKSRVNNLSELVEALGFIFTDELVYEPELLIWKKSDRESTKDNLLKLHKLLHPIKDENWLEKKLEETIKKYIQEHDINVGDVLWPMRVALSGQKNSPGPFEIAAVIGKNETLKRIENAISKLK
ncbi:MAG: glutamate--tRNA ligase [Candidatus Magasanikbacteria bacterium]|nr:glutamate--tRNA ligase [Candidatus Magasanikbacteria bacterium]